MAFDYGTRRVGVSVTDPLKIIANAIGTYPEKEIIDFIKKYVISETVEAFVVGIPMNPGYEENEVTNHIRNFMNLLTKLFPTIPIFQCDERFTSKIATQTILMSGVNKKRRQEKGLKDTVSATIILQSFLENPSVCKTYNP